MWYTPRCLLGGCLLGGCLLVNMPLVASLLQLRRRQECVPVNLGSLRSRPWLLARRFARSVTFAQIDLLAARWWTWERKCWLTQSQCPYILSIIVDLLNYSISTLNSSSYLLLPPSQMWESALNQNVFFNLFEFDCVCQIKEKLHYVRFSSEKLRYD